MRTRREAGLHAPSRGFTIVSAIFLLVVLAALGVFILSVSTTQHLTSAQDVQGSRAYHAARAGLEWGIYKVLDPTNATVAAMVSPYGGGAQPWPNLPPPCTATTLTIEGFSVAISCTRYPGTATYYTEAGTARAIAVYTITATASMGVVGSPGRVERSLFATVSKCRENDVIGTPPAYECP